MFNFSIDDQKKYKKGDYINGVKITNYIDEPASALVQHLAVIYGEALHIAMQFDIVEKDINTLAYDYLKQYYPEDVKKLIIGRMKSGEYQSDITIIKREG